MTHKAEDGTVYLIEEPPGKCELCGAVEETRPTVMAQTGNRFVLIVGRKIQKQLRLSSMSFWIVDD